MTRRVDIKNFLYKNRFMQVVVHQEEDPVIRLFSALANPLRATIIHRLISGSADVSALVELLQTSQPLVSHHLRILRDAHLVEGIRVGRRVEYQLVDDHVAHIFLDAYTHTKEHSDDCHH